jgi:aspartate 1-decarboxylase
MKKSIIYSLVFLLLPSVSLKADVKLYIMPRVYKGTAELRVMDIARIEGDRRDVERIGREVILSGYYSDGLVDRSELYRLVNGMTEGLISIYGSASRICDGSDMRKSGISESKEQAVELVKNGDRVKVIVIKKRMRIEISGKARGSGSRGDEIEVRLKNKRSVRGTITGRGRVEIEL